VWIKSSEIKIVTACIFEIHETIIKPKIYKQVQSPPTSPSMWRTSYIFRYFSVTVGLIKISIPINLYFVGKIYQLLSNKSPILKSYKVSEVDWPNWTQSVSSLVQRYSFMRGFVFIVF
jgi:hypothetical protein